MKNTMKTFAVATLFVVAAMSMAQGRMQFGGRGNTQSSLLSRPDVQKEIKLTDDQKAKLDAMRQSMRESMQAAFQNSGGDREAMQKQMGDMMAKADKDSMALLNDDQKKRLKELWIQRVGNRVLSNEDMQKELGLTEDQKTKVKSLIDAQNAANQEIFQKMRDGSLDQSEIRPLMEKNNKTLSDELGKVLTTEQADKLKAMRGAEFKFDEDGGN